MKITAFAGSNSRHSINKQLLTFIGKYFTEQNYELLDLNEFTLPLFGVDLENEIGIPKQAEAFAEKIDQSDLLIISLAEHNGSYSSAFKNLFDWISRIKGRKAFGNKPMFIMACSDGSRGGSTVLETAKNRMPFSGGQVIESFSFPKFYDNFTDEMGITNDALKIELETKIDIVKSHLKTLLS